MSEILLVRAHYNSKGLEWRFVDEKISGGAIKLESEPIGVKIGEGDEWHVELVAAEREKRKLRNAVVRLVARVRERKDWEKITALPDFWTDPLTLRCLLSWLNSGVEVMLIGQKGTGKTTIPYKLAEALGWQEPLKVDVYTIQKTTELFGSNAASQGTSRFVGSSLYDYIRRAIIAEREGLLDQFLVILDEINRVHARVNESLHGLFDDTRQVTFITAEGSITIKLPKNLHFIGTMNQGAQYLGAHGVDLALKDRFAPLKLVEMPIDYEVAKLVREVGVLETQALAIVRVARKLRDAERAGQLTFSPSYRGCRNAGHLVRHGVSLKEAIVLGFMSWYEGELSIEHGEFKAKNAQDEVAKAMAALSAKVADIKIG